MEWRGEDSRDLFRVEAWNHGLLDISALPISVGTTHSSGCVRVLGLRMQEGDTWAHHELGLGEAKGQLADVLDAEGWRQFAVIEREADFLVGFAPGDLERGLR
jgi:hypothetical protein